MNDGAAVQRETGVLPREHAGSVIPGRTLPRAREASLDTPHPPVIPREPTTVSDPRVLRSAAVLVAALTLTTACTAHARDGREVLRPMSHDRSHAIRVTGRRSASAYRGHLALVDPPMTIAQTVDKPSKELLVTATSDAPAQTAAARAVDARKTYGSGEAAVHALAGVTVDFPDREFTAIMGPSGSGKSTLMQCVAGLDRLTSGEVFIGDTDISKLNKNQLTLLRRDRLGFIFQQYNLIPSLTARENILLPLTLAGTKADAAWFDEIVRTVGLQDRLGNLPSQLSGGQQQRVAVARALVPKPDIVFADEPTGALDSRTGIEILTFMRRAVDDTGQTIVMVTHDPHAASYANRVLFLADGQIVDSMDAPTADRVLDRMKQFEG